MAHFILDLIAITLIALMGFCVGFYLIYTLKVKQFARLLLSEKHQKKCHFPRRSPKILKIWLQQNNQGKQQLNSRLFFSYVCDNAPYHGQMTLSGKTLVDLKYYPKSVQSPNGALPIFSANDEHIKDDTHQDHPE